MEVDSLLCVFKSTSILGLDIQKRSQCMLTASTQSVATTLNNFD